MKIIAFGHQKYVGKDTAGRFLLSYLRLNRIDAARCSFADEIKKTAYLIYKWAGLREACFYENNPHLKDVPLPLLSTPDRVVTPRKIWISIGNGCRSIFPDTWVAAALESKSHISTFIITDLRFENEFNFIKSKGGLCFKIERPSIEESRDEADDGLRGFSKWDGTILNDGDLRSFNQKIVELGVSLKGYL